NDEAPRSLRDLAPGVAAELTILVYIDGLRALANVHGHHCELVSRNGHFFMSPKTSFAETWWREPLPDAGPRSLDVTCGPDCRRSAGRRRTRPRVVQAAHSEDLRVVARRADATV